MRATGRTLSPRKTFSTTESASTAASVRLVGLPTTTLETLAPSRAKRRAAAEGPASDVSRPSVTNTAPASSSDGMRARTSSSAAEKSVVRSPNSNGSTSYLPRSRSSSLAAMFVAAA